MIKNDDLMKTKTACFLWIVLVSTAAYAQIEAGLSTGGGGGCSVVQGTDCVMPTALTANVHIGDTLIVAYSAGVNTLNPTISGCGQTWPAVNRFTGTNFAGGIWIIPHATAAATGCAVTLSSQTAFFAGAFQIYSNVLSVGTPQIVNTASSGSPTMSAPTMTATSAGSFIVGMFFSTSPNIQPMTAGTGSTQRRSPGGYSGMASGMWLGDASASSAGQQIIVSATANANVTYRRAAVDLAPAPTNQKAHLNDAMQTMLMNSPRSRNYELPATGLSPTWCTWFMPTGSSSNIYELEPTSTQVNGQTSNIRIPSWQMTRICQDASGHFWASPPLLAGTGISITPSPIGLTISAGPGGMAYIAGGTSTLPGTVAVAANTCTNLQSTTATGVEQTDVVSWSFQPAAGSTGWDAVHVYPLTTPNTIAWRGCNSTSSSATPSARDVNWYVLRHGATPVVHRAAHRRGKKQ